MTWESIGPFLVGFAGAVVSIISAFLSHRVAKRQVDNEEQTAVAGAADVIVDSAAKQVELSNRTVTRLERRIKALEDNAARDRKEYAALVTDLIEGVKVLVQQVGDLGGVPKYKAPKVPAWVRSET